MAYIGIFPNFVSQNRHEIVTPHIAICILSVYTLIKVVSYYDLSVLSMSVMGFHKKSLDGAVGGVRSIQFFFDFWWNFFNFAKHLIALVYI